MILRLRAGSWLAVASLQGPIIDPSVPYQEEPRWLRATCHVRHLPPSGNVRLQQANRVHGGRAPYLAHFATTTAAVVAIKTGRCHHLPALDALPCNCSLPSVWRHLILITIVGASLRVRAAACARLDAGGLNAHALSHDV